MCAEEKKWNGHSWYPNKNLRVNVDYEQTNFTRGAAANEDQPTENIVLTGLQLAY